MAWDFETEPEFETKLEWIRQFVREKVEPLDLIFPHRSFHPLDDETGPLVRPMQDEVRAEGLWGAHLGPELGGKGFGQLKLALINEILGTSGWAPIVFGTAAPDTGNAEIIAHYGTEAQKEKYLQPLLNGECFSCYSMTEPQAGADPKMFTTRAVKDGDEWVINGYKFFSSNARTARFIIVMAVTDPDVSAYQGMSMFLVPSDTPGVDVVRHVGLMGEGPDEGMHALIHYNDCRVPADALLGGEGQAFAVAQTRLGGGRVHHAMRTVGVCQKALDMMCERALSRETQGSILADKQMVQSDIADAYAELIQFRLLVLYTAWEIDRYHDYKRVRKNIATIKFLTPKVQESIVFKAMHLHGALGVSNEMPFGSMWSGVPIMASVDGPSEVHKVTAAKEVLKGYKPVDGLWPSEWLPAKREEARKKIANMLEHTIGNSYALEHAFGDVTVLDLSVHPGGAIAAMHLGEYGARVLRVDSPSDAPAQDEALWRYANRTKEIVLSADGVVQELASRADVVVVDLRPGDLVHAGLDAEHLRADNPSLVHAWMPPHGPAGETADLPYDELLLWAWTGLASQQPGATSDHPVAPVVPIITYEQGALGATAIVAALIERRTHGAVRSLTVSGLHAVNAMNTSIRIDLPGMFRPFGANKDGTGVSPQFRMYRCCDGVWLFVCALTPPFFFKLLEALALMEVMVLPEVDGDFARFVQPEVQAIVNAWFAERMAERDSGEWARRFDELGVPYAPVQTREEWAASETVAANDLLVPVPGDEATTGPGLPAVLAATPGSLEPSEVTAAPAAPGVVAAPGAPALPLDGVLVVDATKFLAGPFGCLVLQDLGARVVKVDPPGGEDFRTVAAASYCALNRDKDQVCIDLKDSAGRDAFTALVHRADALVENMSRQVVDELGLDVGALRAGNAGLVHCHIDGWGAGPLEDTAGFDPLLQARSGLMVAQGGADTPVIQPMSLHDIGTGTLAAFGTLTALYARTHLGLGQDVGVALSRTSVAFQAAEFTTYPYRPAPRVGYIDYVGDGPGRRFVEAADGWLGVSATTDAQRAAWDGIRGVDDAALAELTVDAVVDACRAAGVPAIGVLGRDEVYSADVLTELGCWLVVDDDDLGEVRVIRGYSEWDGVPARTRAVMHAAGRDTDEVFAMINDRLATGMGNP